MFDFYRQALLIEDVLRYINDAAIARRKYI